MAQRATKAFNGSKHWNVINCDTVLCTDVGCKYVPSAVCGDHHLLVNDVLRALPLQNFVSMPHMKFGSGHGESDFLHTFTLNYTDSFSDSIAA